MKRFLAIVGIFSVLFPAVCSANGYIIANYGIGGGDVDDPSLGIEMGGIFLSSLHPTGGALSIGLGVSVADTDENPPSGIPGQGLVYDPLIKYNDGKEQEIDLTFGAELIPSLFAVAGIGYAGQDTVRIGTNGNQNYEVDSDTERNAAWMLGTRYVIKGLNVGIGYHSRRGIMAGVGIAF